MALIGMAVYSTEENKKDECLETTLEGIYTTWGGEKRHRLILSVNAFTPKTDSLINDRFLGRIISDVIWNKENIGTAKAINKVWQLREPGEHCIKMDDDIEIHTEGWVEQMEDAINRDPTIGQCGLKRKDCWEHPAHENQEWRSELLMLPHQPGEKWIVAERSKHIIGSCVMHSSALIDRVGYLWQPGLYGYDDVLMSWRSSIAGFKNVFLPHINIDHIDPGDTPYQGWKERHSGQYSKEVSDIVDKYLSRELSIYYEP
jgi:GT2 family glycosyltransferase